ncbi:DUF262 domain-containing protein [Mycobacterium timonense]|nr:MULTISPECIES: DUF262 domain-containing protein [Mycobacterium avium complex (MAC)]MBZ4613711.1 DUF262 domain-containing protein [Mycobacterium avium subsp. hominissuis]MCV6991630.1 DUF262 domain-containing protein [Mycobacterium bouchedurhonense]MCV6996663.1 DUF262 domain-containing protein [Mycobacterium timonense]
MIKPIDAGEVQLGKLFTAEYDFTIPDYQRPYAWGKDETLQLLDDLQGSLDRDTDEPYFLGSVVLVKEKGIPASEVIDGQQRLTTLTILFAVLRDLATDPALQADIHKFIEEPAVVWDNRAATPRLRLRARDAKFFRTHIQTTGAIEALIGLSDNQVGTDAQKAIRDNAKALYEVLSTWTAEERKKLFVMMASRTFLVVVSTPDLNSAYRIFSVMNSRGLPLTPPDIFKSQVIGAIAEGDRATYADLWEDLEQELGRNEFGELFLYLRTIVSKARAVRGLLVEFPEQVLSNYLPSDGAGFIDNLLEPYALADQRLINQDFDAGGTWDSVNAWLKRLVQIDNADWRPPALWALKNHGDDPEFLNAFLTRLERLAASLLIRRVYTTPRVLRYLDLLKQLDAGDGLESLAFGLSDEEKKETRERISGEIYLVTPVRKYVLLRLDSIIAANPGASYAHKIITVEHVLPQNPRPDSQWVKDFTEEERTYWTHRIGNLLLLNRTKNSEAQNYDFDVKKAKYFTSRKGAAIFALTTQVLGYQEWTPAVIEQRQAELTNKLESEWKLN